MLVETVNEKIEYKGSGLPRSTDTIHLTSIISAIEKEMGWEYKGTGFKDFELAGEMGFMWEDVLTLVMAERYVGARLGEVEKDGIVGSPDGIGIDPETGEVVLTEHKLTWRSINKPIEKNWKWMTQAKGYCHMLDLDTVIFRVFHIMGDYAGSGPLPQTVRIRYNWKELEDNWKMLTDYMEKLKEEQNENNNN